MMHLYIVLYTCWTPPCAGIIWSSSDFVFLASACEGGWPVLSIALSTPSPHNDHTDRILTCDQCDHYGLVD